MLGKSIKGNCKKVFGLLIRLDLLSDIIFVKDTRLTLRKDLMVYNRIDYIQGTFHVLGYCLLSLKFQ